MELVEKMRVILDFRLGSPNMPGVLIELQKAIGPPGAPALNPVKPAFVSCSLSDLLADHLFPHPVLVPLKRVGTGTVAEFPIYVGIHQLIG